MSERETSTRMPWVALPGETLKGAPPLWAREEGGRIVQVGDAPTVEPGRAAVECVGWFEAVDAEGRSR